MVPLTKPVSQIYRLRLLLVVGIVSDNALSPKTAQVQSSQGATRWCMLQLARAAPECPSLGAALATYTNSTLKFSYGLARVHPFYGVFSVIPLAEM